MPAERKVVAIVGDDFVPSRLFVEAIEQHPELGREMCDFSTVDLINVEYHSGPEEGVREFLGSARQWLKEASDASVLMTTFAPVTDEAIAACPELELIVCARGGPVNVDLAAATERGIPVAFTPGRNAEAVAEFVLGLMILLVRRIPAAYSYTLSEWTSGREDTFEKPSGPELRGKTLGLVGLGAIGARVAELVAPLSMRILAADPNVSGERMGEVGAQSASLRDLLKESDVVSVHARIPPSAAPLIGAGELSRMKPGAYFINTARATTVDERALVDALMGGKLAGAALDVYREEPLPANHPLRGLPNVVLTPHAAGVSYDVPRHSARFASEALARWVADGSLPAVANPDVLERSGR
jgi:D-3-phosphoglycerate dehydrogenase / 2-oxoglutarate reductase